MEKIKTKRDAFAFISFVCVVTAIMGIWGGNTIIGLLALISPPVGLIFGILGLRSQRRTLAIISIVINFIILPLSLFFI
jgi:hypothetical protein